MQRSSRDQALRSLSILFAIAPFAISLIPALGPRHDWRLLWMAFAAFGGAGLAMVIERSWSRGSFSVRQRSTLMLVTAALLAAATAYLLGATSGPGIWGLAVIFGLSWAASGAFNAMSRPRTV